MSRFFKITGNEEYLQKVSDESHISENREPTPFKFYWIEEESGNKYGSDLISPYIRVRRKFNYRLENNTWIEKRDFPVKILR